MTKTVNKKETQARMTPGGFYENQEESDIKKVVLCWDGQCRVQTSTSNRGAENVTHFLCPCGRDCFDTFSLPHFLCQRKCARLDGALQNIRNCIGWPLSRRQRGDIVKLSNLQHFVTLNATAAADGHKSWVTVHCNQMLWVERGRSVRFLIFWRNVL